MRERVDSILVSEMCISEMCISEARVSEERDCKIHIAASRQTRQDLITSSSAFMPQCPQILPQRSYWYLLPISKSSIDTFFIVIYDTEPPGSRGWRRAEESDELRMKCWVEGIRRRRVRAGTIQPGCELLGSS